MTPAGAGEDPASVEPPEAEETAHRLAAGIPKPAPRWLWVVAEGVVAIGVALLFAAWSVTIDVNPMTRVGQVSGLAALQFRFAVVCIVIVSVLLFIELRLPKAAQHARAIGCAAVAGLAGGLVGGGIAVVLHGTPWGLFVNYGDIETIQQWVAQLIDGQPIPGHYPPLSLYVLAALQDWGNQPFGYALKLFQVGGTALFGPAAYLLWRLTLAPLPALAIGVVTMLPFVEPYKPYTQIVLVMLLPLLIKFLDVLRRCSSMSGRGAIATGIGFGAVFGVLFLTYSGWFVWGAAGAVVAVLALLPWRTGLRPAVLILGSTLLAFVVVAGVYLRGLLAQSGGVEDTYMYFDTNSDPAYIAMWRGSMPGNAGIGGWPPLGEFAGVGVFTLLLIAGLTLAIGLGWRRTVVIGLGLPMVSAWLLRQYFASRMQETGLVQLYPRTTMFVLLGLLLLSGFALLLTHDRIRHELRQRVWRAAPVALMLIPLMFMFASAGSAITDRFMPANDKRDVTYFAWISQTTRLPDGSCPPFAPDGICNAFPK